MGGLLLGGALLRPVAGQAQSLDLTQGGPINITARDGIDWHQAEQEVIARGDAVAVRGNVTVTGDRLIAWYRKKGPASPAPTSPGTTGAATPKAATSARATPTATGLAADTSTEGNEIYRLQAEGHVRIFTATDQAQGDKATYDLDQAVMVMTGGDLKLTTPNDVLTARDDLEYWPQKHMAVARGDAVVITNDGRRVSADTLVAYTKDAPTPPPGQTPAHATQAAMKSSDDPLGASGKVDRVEAFGHVSIRTATDTVTGERGVYVPDTGMARVIGNVQITRGQNQLNGAEADVNMKTGIATLISTKANKVHGLILPNDTSSKALANGMGNSRAGTAAPGAVPSARPGGAPARSAGAIGQQSSAQPSNAQQRGGQQP